MICSRLLLLMAAGCVLSCSSTGVGNPGVSTQSLVVTNDPEVEPVASDVEEQLDATNLRHAILVLGEIRFLACDSGSDDDTTLPGPFVVDLVRNRITPEIGAVEWPSQGFCGIDATLAPARAPADIAGRSLFYSGLRSDGTLFLVFANMTGTLHLRPLDGKNWESEPEKKWFWAMRPRRWLVPSELDSSETESLDGTGRVVAIDLDRHPILYSSLRARLAGRSTLHVDLNANGQFDRDERRGDAWIGQGQDSLD